MLVLVPLVIGMLGLGVLFTRGTPVEPASPSGRGASVQVTAMRAGEDLGDTITELQQRLRRVPGDHIAWAALGTAYVQQAAVTADPAYYPKAEGALRRSLRIRPQRNAPALTGQAALAAARHDFREALQHARAARRINPYIAANQGVLTDALQQLGRYDRARRELQRMLDLQPGVASFTRASYAFELRGQLGAAEHALRRALDLASRRSDRAWCLYYLGELAWNAGHLDRADRYYARGLRLSPSYTQLLAGRAKVAAARGQSRVATRRYEKVVRRQPTPTHLIRYADLLRAMDREQAAERAEAVVAATAKLFRDHGVGAGVEVALFEADRGHGAAALRAARSAWQRQRSIEAADAYAWALHVAGRHEDALRYAERADRLGTSSALFAFHRGMIQKALGRAAAARTSLREAMRINPHFSPLLAPRAAAALRELRNG